MCIVIALVRMTPDMPLMVAANRDEFFDRPSEGPTCLDQYARIFGGRDLRGGGTWLAVKPNGFFAALTNEPHQEDGGIERPSRGEIIPYLLAAPDLDAILRRAENLRERPFAPFNLMLGDGARLAVIRSGHVTSVQWVGRGIHILPNGPLNDVDIHKVRRARKLCYAALKNGEISRELPHILADTRQPDVIPNRPMHQPVDFAQALEAIKVVTPIYGSRSSSILMIRPGKTEQYLHAEGPPGEVGFHDWTHLFDRGVVPCEDPEKPT